MFEQFEVVCRGYHSGLDVGYRALDCGVGVDRRPGVRIIGQGADHHGADADLDPAKSGAPATVSMTNTGQSTCTVQGHPQVDLISTAGDDWPLVSQSGPTPKLSLKPGMSALANLCLLSHTAGAGTEAFQVKSAVIIPPDAKTPTTVAWPWAWALERQDAATSPGTFIGAVSQTAG